MKIKHKDGKWLCGEKGLLASILGIANGTLSRILSGEMRCSAELAAKIEKVTEGQITRMDLLYRHESANILLPHLSNKK